MSVHRLEVVQTLAVDLDEAWRFFSNPRNLAVITPPNLGFEIAEDLPDHVYPGLLLQYRVRPLFGIPVRWMTEITHVEERRRFVDEQRIGPYRLWHHEHDFTEIPGGVEARDLVHYVLPGGPLGDVANRLSVRPRLGEIFEFRRAVLAQRFGAVSGATR